MNTSGYHTEFIRALLADAEGQAEANVASDEWTAKGLTMHDVFLGIAASQVLAITNEVTTLTDELARNALLKEVLAQIVEDRDTQNSLTALEIGG